MVGNMNFSNIVRDFSILRYIKNEDKYILFIYVFLFLLPWNFFKWQVSAFSIILLLWWVFRYKNIFLERINQIFKFYPILILLTYLLYTYISIFWSDFFIDGLDHVNQFHKYYFIFILVLFTTLNSQQAFNGIKIIIISFSLYSLFSICIYLGLFSIESTNSNELNPKGIMAYAISSMYMAIGIITTFIIFTSSKKMNKIFRISFFVFFILCFIALFVNNSRTSQLAFILASFTLIVFYYKSSLFKLRNIIKVFLVTILISGTMIIFLKNNDKLERYTLAYEETKKALFEDDYTGSFGYRLYFNKAGIEILKDNFFFGMGPEDNTKELEKLMLRDNSKYNFGYIFTSFHSQHMDILTRYGFFGYLLLFFSIISLLYTLRNNKIIFWIGLGFFITTFYGSFANVLLIKKPFNYIIICVFVLLSVISFKSNEKQKLE